MNNALTRKTTNILLPSKYRLSLFYALCFTSFRFKLLIFVLMPFCWLSSWTLPGQYESHGAEQKWPGCALIVFYFSHRALGFKVRPFGLFTCNSIFFFVLPPKARMIHQTEHQQQADTMMNNRNNKLRGVICG